MPVGRQHIPGLAAVMVVQSNGRAKKPNKATQNGYANGHANGHLNGHLEKSNPSGPMTRSSTQRKPRTSLMRSLVNIFGRYDGVSQSHGLHHMMMHTIGTFLYANFKRATNTVI